MADWSAIRRLAREARASLALPESPDDGLADADAVLAAALEREGLWTDAVAPSDPALAGAQALLERESQGILYDATLPAEATRFNIAHELAHWFLHSDEPPAPCAADDIVADPVAEPLPYGQEAVSGYSPRQRRETEANVFAAELLLPAPALRAAFVAGATHTEIAAAIGLTEPAVLGQLAEALLTPGTHSALSTQHFDPSSLIPHPSSLDASQRAAAVLDHGPALVIAGPGTGKTRTLVARVLHLLEQGVPPERILALTFSNKAANEMRERLAAALPEAARRLWIGTFHAFGLELLRRYGTRLGLPPAPALVDRLDAIALLERHLDELDLREYEFLHDPIFPFRDILGAISRAKDELVTPEHYAELAGRMETLAEDEAAQTEAVKAREVARVYAAWQRILQREGKLDFGDLLMRAAELLTAHPAVLAEVRAQYPQVLVDEYQDINRASAVLVRLVAGEGAGLWAVGDLRQAIYQFRGASPANVAQFEQDFPSGRRLSLDVNYRSRAPIVRLFGATAGSAKWQAQRGEGDDAVVLAVADDEEAQADGIAQTIRRFAERGFALRDQAVLCRTNAQAEALAAKLEARGVPVIFLGDLLARPEVRDLLALLSLACETTGQGLYRVARFPEYETPPDTVRALLARAKEHGKPFPGALAGCGVPALERLYAHVQPLAHHGDAYSFFTRYLFGPADYLRRLLREDTAANRQRLLAFHQLLRLARGLTARLGPAEEGQQPQRAFLAHVRRLMATGEDGRARTPAGEEEIEGVRLLTVHAAKGLEFPVVFLPNLAKDLFPGRGRPGMVKLPPGVLPETTGTEDDEEVRLFFVALSRARDHLVLSRPATVNGKPRDPSPLLARIEPALQELRAEQVEWNQSGIGYWVLGIDRTEVVPNTQYPIPNTQYPLPAIEQYQRCPRRYYYEYALELPRAREETAWSAAQRCVRETKAWLRAERAEGRKPDSADAMARLDVEWRERGPAGHPQEQALRARAEAIVTEFAKLAALPREGDAEAPEEVMAELPSGRIRVPLDHATEAPDGALTVERHEAGRRANLDHTDPRLALLRQAARQSRPGREVKVILRHLPTGATRDVPEQPRYEPKRVQKYEDALRGIAQGEYEPRPSEECAGCPFLFICPA